MDLVRSFATIWTIESMIRSSWSTRLGFNSMGSCRDAGANRGYYSNQPAVFRELLTSFFFWIQFPNQNELDSEVWPWFTDTITNIIVASASSVPCCFCGVSVILRPSKPGQPYLAVTYGTLLLGWLISWHSQFKNIRIRRAVLDLVGWLSRLKCDPASIWINESTQHTLINHRPNSSFKQSHLLSLSLYD